MSFGDYLKKERKKKRLTMRELERKSGISQAYISQIESGKRNAPKPETLNKLAKGLSIPNGNLLMAAGYIDDPFDHAYRINDGDLIKADKDDIRYQLQNKDDIYYDEKLLTEDDKSLATDVLDKLFK